MAAVVTQRAKRALRRVLPLSWRKQLAVWLGQLSWLPPRHWWAMELLRDLAQQDPDAYHRFLWTHHLGYAETYELPRRFGRGSINETRHLLFADLRTHLVKQGVDPTRDVRSVFEVGCSMGYLLRFIETDVFPATEVLEGIDIDRYAIRTGSEWLRSQGSRVRLAAAEMEELHRVMRDRRYDVILCAGVLMYLREAAATRVVRAMLEHTSVVLALAGLAHPERDNRLLERSDVRARDGTFIHNLDAMVREAGGRVVFRRWDGPRLVDGNTVYFVFAARAEGAP